MHVAQPRGDGPLVTKVPPKEQHANRLQGLVSACLPPRQAPWAAIVHEEHLDMRSRNARALSIHVLAEERCRLPVTVDGGSGSDPLPRRE